MFKGMNARKSLPSAQKLGDFHELMEVLSLAVTDKKTKEYLKDLSKEKAEIEDALSKQLESEKEVKETLGKIENENGRQQSLIERQEAATENLSQVKQEIADKEAEIKTMKKELEAARKDHDDFVKKELADIANKKKAADKDLQEAKKLRAEAERLNEKAQSRWEKINKAMEV